VLSSNNAIPVTVARFFACCAEGVVVGALFAFLEGRALVAISFKAGDAQRRSSSEFVFSVLEVVPIRHIT